MTATLDRLHLDHKRLAKILEATETFTTRKRKPSGSALDQLLCLIEYVTEYPDEVHHPLEDRVFGKMSDGRLSEKEAADLQKNVDEHANLKDKTEDLLLRLQGNRELGTWPVFNEDLKAYIDQQRDHMRFEERRIFPMAEEHLSELEWEGIRTDNPATSDPLFDLTEQRFEAIFNYVVDAPYGDAPSTPRQPPNQPPAEDPLSQSYVADLGFMTELQDKLAAIQAEQLELLMDDHKKSWEDLANNPPPQVFLEHLSRRTTHYFEGVSKTVNLFNAEMERWIQAQQRLFR